jgi:hypothetical protein
MENLRRRLQATGFRKRKDLMPDAFTHLRLDYA